MQNEPRGKRPPREVRTFRVRPDEWAVVEAAAAALNEPPSTWLRRTAVAQARRELTGDEQD